MLNGTVDKIFIIHYTPAFYRRKLMMNELLRVGVGVQANVEFVEVYDRENISAGNLDTLRLATCTRCGMSGRHGNAICSVNLKHLSAWMDIVRRNYDVALILEDDIELGLSRRPKSFALGVVALLEDLHANAFDTIVLGTCGFSSPGLAEKGTVVSPRIVRPRSADGASRCAGAYLVSNRGARRLLAGLPFPSRLYPAPDHHINKVAWAVGKDFVGLWAWPPLARDMRLPKKQRHSWRKRS